MTVELTELYSTLARFRANPRRIVAIACVAVLLGACAARRPGVSAPDTSSPEVAGEASTLRSITGLASFYGPGFHGRTTASGVRFDRRAPVAAHPEFPFGTRVRVTNLSNLKQVVLTIVDRGPTRENQRDGVIIDVSEGAARTLGFTRKGRQRVRVDVLRWGDGGA